MRPPSRSSTVSSYSAAGNLQRAVEKLIPSADALTERSLSLLKAPMLAEGGKEHADGRHSWDDLYF